jgi:hypothetical protein
MRLGYRRTVSGIFAFIFIASFLLTYPLQHVSAATFNPNLIMDDSVMSNYNSMNASQIDSFLNSFPNSCISTNNGFSAIEPIGYNHTNGFLYGSNVSAGTIIYDAAQAYNLNPEVLLVTLQKEQSLVKGDAGCATNRYAKAVGYGCPDGGSSYTYTGVNLYTKNGVTYTTADGVCVNDASKVGFTQQIIRAAWMLKYSQQRSLGNIGWAIIKPGWDNSDDLSSTYSGYMTQGCLKRSKYEATCTNYDGYATIDNTAVHLDNGATAALYRYTPHFSGNTNFFNIFTSWFGATTGPDYAASFTSFNLYSDSAHTQLLAQVGPENKYILTPGQVVYALANVQNSGRATWDSNTHLGTAQSRDRISPFANSDWLAPQRPAALSVSSLGPNGNGTFSFTLKAPVQAGRYMEGFGVVDDGKVWTDAVATFRIDVTTSVSPPQNYTANILDSSGTNTLPAGNSIISPDSYSSLSLLPDGTLNLWNDFRKVWGAGVKAGAGSKLILQPDGNLVLYNANSQPTWNTETNGKGASKLYVQEDGNMVLYNTQGPTWSSGTNNALLHYSYTQDMLSSNSYLFKGQQLVTPDRKRVLVLQQDGNLVLYNVANMKPLWNTQTNNKGGYELVLQQDGNLVLYTQAMKPVWASGTDGKSGTGLFLQQDGNLVLYTQAMKPVWASGTSGQ